MAGVAAAGKGTMGVLARKGQRFGLRNRLSITIIIRVIIIIVVRIKRIAVGIRESQWFITSVEIGSWSILTLLKSHSLLLMASTLEVVRFKFCSTFTFHLYYVLVLASLLGTMLDQVKYCKWSQCVCVRLLCGERRKMALDRKICNA